MAMVASQTSKLLRPPSAIAVVIVLCTGPRPLPPPSPPPPLCAGAAPVPPNPAAAAAVMYLVFASSALTPSLAFHASLRRREEEREMQRMSECSQGLRWASYYHLAWPVMSKKLGRFVFTSPMLACLNRP